MTAQRGSAFLLKIGDGAAPPAYQTVAGLRTTQLAINGDSVVVTHKESGGWRELLSGAGTRSVSGSAGGITLQVVQRAKMLDTCSQQVVQRDNAGHMPTTAQPRVYAAQRTDALACMQRAAALCMHACRVSADEFACRRVQQR